MAKNFDLQDAGAVASIAAAILALDQVLNQPRSVILQIDNQTELPMKRISDHHVHGGFSEFPADIIPPQTASLFSSQSDGGSIATGTEGSCSYLVGDVQVDFFWDNPFIGSNSCDLHYNGNSVVQFRMGHNCGTGNTGAHNHYTVSRRALADFHSQRFRGNPCMIQSKFNADLGHGNFELLVPLAGGGLGAYFRENNTPGLPWETSAIFGQSAGLVDAVSMIQSNFGDPGNLEVVARTGDKLQFFFRDSGPLFQWSPPFEMSADNRPIRGAIGTPTLLQSRNGHQGNFELLVPLASGGLAHFFRDNDDPNLPWHGPTIVLDPRTQYLDATMIQSSFGDGHDLEVIGTGTSSLTFFFRDQNFQWQGPFPLAPDGALANGGIFPGGGNLALIQGAFGSAGENFELMGVEATLTGPGRIWHAFRDNDRGDMPWHYTTAIGPSGLASAITMIESNFGSPGHLEAVARQADGGVAFLFRDERGWQGPFTM